MDRTFVYPGAIPQDTDLLQPQRNVMEALGFALAAAFSTSQTLVDGLNCTQSPSPNMSVVVAPGSIIQASVVDTNAYGSLAADTTDPLVKMGINLTSTTLGPFTAPSTAGQSQNFLIEASFSETDVNPTVLPYYNASNPSAPYSGPNNNATAQNTARIERVTLQIVAGSPATTGSQTTPAPSTGSVGLWVVTIANGQSSITNANIAEYPGAPFIPAKLGPGMLPGFSNRQVFATAGSYSFTVPNGVTRAKVTVVGAGGGANGANNSTQFAGASGGGGGWAKKWITGLTPGTVIPVVVGAGGAGVAAYTAGNAGSSSSFGAYCSATGGSGGGVTGNPFAGGSPGAGSGGDIQGDGSYGSDGNGTSAAYWPGISGGSLFGGSARAGAGGSSAGLAPGAGGGAPYNITGNTGSYTGAAGAAGIVIVEF